MMGYCYCLTLGSVLIYPQIEDEQYIDAMGHISNATLSELWGGWRVDSRYEI